MSGAKPNSKTRFHEIAEAKGWKLKEIANRWGVTERQMSRIAGDPKTRDLDAIGNLPNKYSSSVMNPMILSDSDRLTTGTYKKLSEAAKDSQLSTEAYINYLLDDDIQRQRLLALMDEQSSCEYITSVQILTKVVNDLLANLTADNDVPEYQRSIENLHNHLVREKLIKTKVLESQLAESERLKIPRTAYYWYGGSIAQSCGLWFGTECVYLWDEMLANESEVIFIGMPENVVVSYHVCARLCQLLKKNKSQYKKAEGNWGSKSEVEEEANRYINNFASGINSTQLGWFDEDDSEKLFNYVKSNYSWTLR